MLQAQTLILRLQSGSVALGLICLEGIRCHLVWVLQLVRADNVINHSQDKLAQPSPRALTTLCHSLRLIQSVTGQTSLRVVGMGVPHGAPCPLASGMSYSLLNNQLPYHNLKPPRLLGDVNREPRCSRTRPCSHPRPS